MSSADRSKRRAPNSPIRRPQLALNDDCGGASCSTVAIDEHDFVVWLGNLNFPISDRSADGGAIRAAQVIRNNNIDILKHRY